MDKKGEGEFWLMLIFLAMIPLCTHAGSNPYSDCMDDCIYIKFEKSGINETTNKTIYTNGTSKLNYKEVREICFNECKGREK